MDSVLVIEVPGPDVRLVPVRNEFGMLAKGTARLRGVVPDYFVKVEPTVNDSGLTAIGPDPRGGCDGAP